MGKLIEKSPENPVKQKKSIKSVFSRILFIFAAILAFLILTLTIIWYSVDYELDLNSIENVSSKNIFYDIESKEINYKGNGRFINFSEFQDYTINCFVCTEDKNFFKHNGIDTKRILKSALKNAASFSYKEGASTITQQLIKNSQLSNQKTLIRKFKEIKLALKLEKQISKERIMELYLNSIYFGKNCYGIENASKYYFNKSSIDLTLNESAVLAGIINSPAKYSPLENAGKCVARRNFVLKNMLTSGYIDEETFNKVSAEPLKIDTSNGENYNYAYLEAVNGELSKIFNLSEQEIAQSGLKVYTYMDSRLQQEANKLLENEKYFPSYYKNTNNCIVLIDNFTNGISVLATNNALDIQHLKRQPGSCIKPVLVYMPAFEKNIITASTLINDEATVFGDYHPTNFKNKYNGDVTVRTAIKKSLNIPAVKTLNYLGIDSFKEYAKKLNIVLSEKDTGLPMALGGLTDGISLLELTSAYTALANSGNFGVSKVIKKVEDSFGNILYENINSATRIYSEENSFIMTDILMDTVFDGTANILKDLRFDVACKTGTVGTEEGNSDAYNISYTTRHTLSVWAGAKSNNFGQYIMGGTSCAYLAKDFYEKLYNENNIPEDFIIPKTVERLNIDFKNLCANHEITLAASDTPDNFILSEYFSKHNMPTKVSSFFKNIKVTSADVNVFDRFPNIKFTAVPYAFYEIYRDDGNKKELLKTIKDTEGIVEFIDDTVKEGKTYEYTIVPYFNSEKELKKIDNGVYKSQKIIIPIKFVPESDPDEKENPPKDGENWWDYYTVLKQLDFCKTIKNLKIKNF